MKGITFEQGKEFSRWLDEEDKIASFREEFVFDKSDLIYMDGNSLGRLPRRTVELMRRALDEEWGSDLIRSWNKGWYEAPKRTGEKIAKLIGAEPNQVIVSDQVLQALTKPVYAKWRVRGMSETYQSTFGFADKPIVMLINEVTLSDGEMTANGFKTLKRGLIVGNTTYGWLIFTTGASLMNGGYFRLPFWGCYTLDGQDIETMGGIKPDILVINDLNHDLKGEDPQLDKAVREILKKIE